MPVKLERKLKREYRKRGYTGKRLAHAVFGTMNKILNNHKAKIKKRAI